MQQPKISTFYRIALAISLALFLHVILVLAAGSWWQRAVERENEPSTIAVRIAPHGQRIEKETTASSAQSRGSRSQEEAATNRGGKATVISSEKGDTSAPIKAPPNTRSPGKPDVSAARQGSGRNDSVSSLQQLFGSASPREREPDEDTRITRLSEKEVEKLSEYEIKLWRKIAAEVSYAEILSNIGRERSVTMELRIMSNGALRRARITQSSGLDALDKLGRRAALSASPYPQPPGGSGPFNVKLVFLPKS